MLNFFLFIYLYIKKELYTFCYANRSYIFIFQHFKGTWLTDVETILWWNLLNLSLTSDLDTWLSVAICTCMIAGQWLNPFGIILQYYIFFLQILPKGKQSLSDPSTNEWRECSCMIIHQIIQNIIFHLSQLLCLYLITKICIFQKGGRVRIPSLSTLCNNRDQYACLIQIIHHYHLFSPS